jgi:hypothetical protein
MMKHQRRRSPRSEVLSQDLWRSPKLCFFSLCSSSYFIWIILLLFGLVLWLELVLAATQWYSLFPATISYSKKIAPD